MYLGAAVLLGVLLLGTFVLLKGQNVSAAWVEQTIDQQSEYSKFPLENYALDISGDGGFLSDVGMSIMNFLANALFWISNMLSYFCGWVMGEAYQLDFLGSAIDSIAQNIHIIAGVDARGFRSHGLLPSLAPLLILLAGGYFVWVGVFRRKTAQAAVNLASFVMIFVLGMGVIAYAGGYMTMINNFQREFNAEVMEVSSMITLGGSEEEGTDMVDQMRDNLFLIMVRNPYLMFQYGTSDEETIGTERVEELLRLEPGSEERQEIVDEEVEDLENAYMGSGHLAERFGMCLVVLLVNLVIGGSVLLFAAMLIMAQVLFVLYMSFFPVALVFSMFPNSGNRLRKILGQCLNTILMRPAISLILTVVLSISMLCYRLGGASNYLWAAFLQGVTFIVAFWKTGEFLGYMQIGNQQQSDRTIMRYLVGGMGARAAYRGGKNLTKQTYRSVKQGGRVIVGGARKAAAIGDAKVNREYYLRDAAMKESVRQQPESRTQTAKTSSGRSSGSGTGRKTSADSSVAYGSSSESSRTSKAEQQSTERKNAVKRTPGQNRNFEKGPQAVLDPKSLQAVKEANTGSMSQMLEQKPEQGRETAPKRLPGQKRSKWEPGLQDMERSGRRTPGQVGGLNREKRNLSGLWTEAAERRAAAKQIEPMSQIERRRPGVAVESGSEKLYQRQELKREDQTERTRSVTHENRKEREKEQK